MHDIGNSLEKYPLVSIVIVTYNSALYVWETLESAKAQTYKNIELIVSDDCSEDNTLDICREWFETYGDRFVRTQINTVPINTGVSANCNRCITASRADWIKLIAGDDILLPNCIEDNISFVKANPETRILFSKVVLYKNDFRTINRLAVVPMSYPLNIMALHFSAEEQFKRLLISDRITFTPSYFFRKEAILSVGGYDENIIGAEDYPMWLKLTRAGIRLDFMDIVTVGYRQHGKAQNNTGDERLFKPLLMKTYAFRKAYVFRYLPWDIAWAERYTVMIASGFEILHLNKSTSFLRWLYRSMTTYLNPFQYVISFKKHVLKASRKNIFYAS